MNQNKSAELSNQKKEESLPLRVTIDTYTKILYNFVRRFGFSDSETEDILQEIFIKIWKYQDSFDEEKASLKTWIFTITKNTIYDALRKKRKDNLILSLDEKNNLGEIEDREDISKDILKLLEKEQVRNSLLSAVLSLNEVEKTIFFLHNEEGLTFNEIATIFASPLNTIKSTYRRSLSKLKKQLSSFAPK
jgi:RNA polymerase sigma-70 factor (ECF subfamily)